MIIINTDRSVQIYQDTEGLEGVALVDFDVERKPVVGKRYELALAPVFCL